MCQCARKKQKKLKQSECHNETEICFGATQEIKQKLQ